MTRGGPTRARLPALLAGLGLAVVVLATPAALAAQEIACDAGDLEVRRLRFDGNRAFPDAQLADAVVTTSSDWARRNFRVLGARRCLDRVELPRDVLRLVIFYRNHGYSQVAVDTSLTMLAKDAVAVTFRISEGQPTILDSIAITGLHGVRRAASIVRALPIEIGKPFDKYRTEEARDLLRRRLRDSGYPTADVLLSFSTVTETRRASVELTVATGPFARIGDVSIEIEPLDSAQGAQISRKTVRRLLGIRRGSPYRESALEAAKRNLYQTDAYRQVEIGVLRDSTAGAPDSVVNIAVAVRESFMRSARTGVGYGTLDCFRAQGEYTDRDFLNGRGRMDLTARLSKIGIGKPLDVARDLCPQIKRDPYSDTLNYYVGATLRQPVLFGLRTVPTVTLFSERRSEYLAYLRFTPIGGVASLGVPARRRLPSATISYQAEYGRTNAEPALFCAVFNLCTADDRRRVQELKRLAVGSLAFARDRSDNPLNPTRGSVARVELRHASTLIGSDRGLQFNKATGDVSWYQRAGWGNVLAARVRAGGVFGSRISLAGSSDFIPPQERLYAGGPTSVRGFRQNELGPAVYVVDTVRATPATDPATGEAIFFYEASSDAPFGFKRSVPTGGNSLLVGTVEYRMRSLLLPDVLQWVAFVDAGTVWNRGGDSRNFSLRDLRVTPGGGFRAFTPIGAIRVDVGYNRYSRPAGAAYYDTPLQGASAPLYCVSPGNRIPVRAREVNGQTVFVQDEPPDGCPGTFAPAPDRRFLRRLTFNFSIGQAF